MDIIETSIIPADEGLTRVCIVLADAVAQELADESIEIVVGIPLENNPPLLAVQADALERAQKLIAQEISRLKSLSSQAG